jgi:hypothetical protein
VLFVSGLLDAAPAEAAKPLDAQNHKRTVYGFVSRRRMDGMLALFDFPNPNSSSEGRVITNVPLQRLFFMNSPFIETAAKAFAGRFSGNADSRIRAMYQAAYDRDPDTEELRLSQEYVSDGSWTGFARVLLGSNEFLFTD